MGTIQIDGSTPKLTIGNATAEDATILFDGNAQDFYIALDDSADDLIIGLGAAVGTTPMLSFTEAKAAAFTGAVTMASTLGVTGVVTGAGFTAGSAVLAEAELELLDGLTAGTAIASKVVTTDANIDTTGQRNLTISGEIDAATGDFSGAVDVAGTTTAVAITASGLITANADMLIGGTTPTLTIGDAGAEDTKIVFDGNAQDWHIGLDDSTDDFVIGLGSTLGTTSHIVIDETGAVTKPLQPAFSAKSASLANQTGAGTEFVVSTWNSERFDLNGDFTSDTFTAPVTGKYFFTFSLDVLGGSSDMNKMLMTFKTSNTTYAAIDVNFSTVRNTVGAAGSALTLTASILADMDASDTCQTAITVFGDDDSLDTQDNGYFTGFLVC